MTGRPLRTIARLLAFAALAALSPAHAQDLQPRPERDCGDIERNYELIKAEAVSMQTNMALFAAADRGCEALAHKLLDAGASLLARDRRGAMPLAHAARGGQSGWSSFSSPTARRSTPAMSTAARRCSPPPKAKSIRPSPCCWPRAPIPIFPAAPA